VALVAGVAAGAARAALQRCGGDVRAATALLGA